MEQVWTELYNKAKEKINTKQIKPFIEYGSNTCAILSKNNKIYVGISVTSTTSLNCNAEKTAITSMLNDGESTIQKIVILNELEEVIIPSIECIEYLMEMNSNPNKLEILIDYDKEKVVLLKDLLPSWWGIYHNKK